MQRPLYTYLVGIILLLNSHFSWGQDSIDLHEGEWHYTLEIEELQAYPQFKEYHEIITEYFQGRAEWSFDQHQILVFSFRKISEEHLEEWLEEMDMHLLFFHRE